MPTDKETLMRERAAYEQGMADASRAFPMMPRNRAAELYPYPTVTRPRVVRDPDEKDYEWRRSQVGLEFRFHKAHPSSEEIGRWHPGNAGPMWGITPERVALWADLLANPTEEVEA